jgi:methylated-DNA-[protein]-cysteine S-methyltransferase
MQIELMDLKTELGAMTLAITTDGLCALDFSDSRDQVRGRLERHYPGASYTTGALAKKAAARVKAYFDGELDALDAFKVAPSGTDFQKQVWAALRKIPIGATWSYAALARKIGNPSAMRAVGAANGRNPITLVVPCHRVIAADGTLHGYGGGLWRKEWLLKHEGALLA